MVSILLALALVTAPQEPSLAVVADSEAQSPGPPATSLVVLDEGPGLPASYVPVLPLAPMAQDTVTHRPRAIRYSDGYYTRLKIHQIASYLTIPLFVAQYAAGKQLYDKGNDAADWAKNGHGPLAATIAGLFAVNTVTGVWNLVESNKSPAGRTRRWIHGVAMIIADAGFVAVGATAPESEEGESEGNPELHRGLAIGSMSLALGSYLMMILWKD